MFLLSTKAGSVGINLVSAAPHLPALAEHTHTHTRTTYNTHNTRQVFLLSTKAGSVGINLVSATRLVLFDVPWNPVHNTQVRFK